MGSLLGMASALAGVQQVAPAEPPPAAPAADERGEVVVTGDRRSLTRDVEAIATFDARTIGATGATTIDEFLRTIQGVTRSPDGSDPIFLLNAQRVSSYQEIGSLPPEAIEKVEVLPEPVALRYGYPPTRRVVNFITKRHFGQRELRAAGGIATRGAGATGTAHAGLTRLANDARLTLGLDYRHTDRITVADRRITPDADILYDGIGNVVGADGGEVDPALSALAGMPVTVAAVPAGVAAPTLADFATGANRPRAFGFGPTRTLVPRNDTVHAEATLGDKIGRRLAGTVTLTADQSRDRNLAGPAVAGLFVPAGNPFSPFTVPVLLNRYLTEVAPLRQAQTTTTLHAGTTLRGAIKGWQWDLTTTLDQQVIAGTSERSIDLAAAQAAIAGGADPFRPLDPALLANRLTDRGQQRTRTGGAKAVVSGSPVALPAGPVTTVATLEAEGISARSYVRGPAPYDLSIGRRRLEAGGSLALPIASRREGFLPALGELSVNAAAAVRGVGGFGTLSDRSLGATWSPRAALQFVALARHAEAPPSIALQSTPTVRAPNTPVLDYVTGRSTLVALTVGGNPDLRAERRDTRSLSLTLKPFAKREWRAALSYEATRIADASANVYALNPLTQAALPGQFTRDASGTLVAVSYRPVNIADERQQTLSLSLTASGQLGRVKPPPSAGAAPPDRATYYAGLVPTLRLSDRLLIAPGSPVLDILAGDSITGYGGTGARLSGYGYGGVNRRGNGLTFNFYVVEHSRIRSPTPTTDLFFRSFFRLNLGGSLALHQFAPHQDWTRHLSLKLDLGNVFDAHQIVRDRTGRIPYTLQPDLLGATGRTVLLTLRKLF